MSGAPLSHKREPVVHGLLMAKETTWETHFHIQLSELGKWERLISLFPSLQCQASHGIIE